MSITRRHTLAAVTATIGLLLSGCGDPDTDQPAETTEPQAAEPSTAPTPDAATGESDDVEPGTGGTDTATEPEAEQDTDETSSLEVSPTGDGPIGLTANGADGEAATIEGRLIVGPGGCLSLTARNQPQLLVLPEGTDFVLRDDRPSLTTEELGTLRVGEQVTLEAVSIAASDASGIPERCSRGAADTLLAVTQ